jgi:hypothetical protein
MRRYVVNVAEAVQGSEDPGNQRGIDSLAGENGLPLDIFHLRLCSLFLGLPVFPTGCGRPGLFGGHG